MTSTEQRAEGDLRGVFEFPVEPAVDDHDPVSAEAPDTTAVSPGERLTRLRSQLSVPRILRRHTGSDDDTLGPEEQSPEAAEFIARANGTSTQRLMTHAARAAVIAALVSGPLGLYLAAGSSAPPQVVSPPPVSAVDTAGQFAASDLAQQFVSAWLTTHRGDEGSLQRFVDVDAGNGTLPAQALYKSADTHIAGVREVSSRADGADTYAVTVSAEVTPAGADTATRRYFQVPVVVSDKGVRAMAMPAAVPAPSTGLTINLDYSNQLSSNAAIVTAAQGFLSAMLTGDGDVTRFTSPGTNLGAITPAPYTSISVTGARTQKSLGDSADTPADGQRARLLLTISQQPPGTASSTDALTGTYALTMVARAGRWEVNALDPTPAAGINRSDVTSSLTGEEDENTDSPADVETSAPDSGEPTSDSDRTPRAGGDDESNSAELLPTVTSEPSSPRSSTSAPTSTPSSGGGGSLLGPGGIDLGPR